MPKDLPARPSSLTTIRATRAKTDEEILESWLSSLTSDHTRRNFEVTTRRFLAGLPMGLRAATVEDVRDALDALRSEVSETTGRQYVLRVKSLLSCAQRVGYTPFNAEQSSRFALTRPTAALIWPSASSPRCRLAC